jgi:hypothetical protein
MRVAIAFLLVVLSGIGNSAIANRRAAISLFPTKPIGTPSGVGILSSMIVGPVGTSFASVVLYETVTPTGNSCPANIQTATNFPTITFSSPFVVGSSAVWEGSPYASVQNAFYDQHTTKSATNVLGLTNVTSCQSTATQVYTCNGNAVGTFSLTNTYTSGFISAQPVTFVSVSKQ